MCLNESIIILCCLCSSLSEHSSHASHSTAAHAHRLHAPHDECAHFWIFLKFVVHDCRVEFVFLDAVVEEHLIVQFAGLDHDFHHRCHGVLILVLVAHHIFHLVHLLLLGFEENFLCLIARDGRWAGFLELGLHHGLLELGILRISLVDLHKFVIIHA